MRKPVVYICKSKGADQLPSNMSSPNTDTNYFLPNYSMSRVMRKPVFRVSAQVQHKLDCIISHCRLLRDLKFWIYDLFVLFDFLFYVHSKHLRSRQDGQLPHCSWASLPEAVYQYLVPILLPVTDNLLFLNQRKRVIIFLESKGRSRDSLHTKWTPYIPG